MGTVALSTAKLHGMMDAVALETIYLQVSTDEEWLTALTILRHFSVKIRRCLRTARIQPRARDMFAYDYRFPRLSPVVPQLWPVSIPEFDSLMIQSAWITVSFRCYGDDLMRDWLMWKIMQG